ncbi:unnamed protein product [Paramecium sonneborni]|uniref:Uncharacterized protein n=1 Tax=Paramecium sonneborni TaxID=65129 RepID=A0A8S1PV81_9CILI|nr:unnamed protein product [Paramecium sonneborni]
MKSINIEYQQIELKRNVNKRQIIVQKEFKKPVFRIHRFIISDTESVRQSVVTLLQKSNANYQEEQNQLIIYLGDDIMHERMCKSESIISSHYEFNFETKPIRWKFKKRLTDFQN